MDKPIDWLYGYFSEKGTLPGASKDEQLRADYFDAGLIDSFGVIDLITSIESQFKVELKPDNMQDIRFRTVKGLAEIIEENREGS